jgi:hypothetical protein
LTFLKICYNTAMLAVQKQQKYIRKAVQLPNGAWALVVFELIEQNGQIIAKAVSGKLLEDTKIEKEDVLCLPGIKSPAEFVPIRYFTSEVLESFLKDFSFVMSQPTRAPNFC